jgi:hypothetical protein
VATVAAAPDVAHTASGGSATGGSAPGAPASAGGATTGGSAPSAPGTGGGSGGPTSGRSAGGGSTGSGSTGTSSADNGPATGGPDAQPKTQSHPATTGTVSMPTPVMPTVAIPRIPKVAAEVDPVAPRNAAVIAGPEREHFGSRAGVQVPIPVTPDVPVPDIADVLATPVPANASNTPELWTPAGGVAAASRASADGTSAPARPLAGVVRSASPVAPPGADPGIASRHASDLPPRGAERHAAAPERRSRLHGAGQVNIATAVDGTPLATGYAPPGGVEGSSGAGGIGAGGAAAALFGLAALWLLSALLPRLLALDLFPLISALCALRLERPG